MRPEKYTTSSLFELFHEQKVLAFDAVSEALGNPSRATVFRKLADMEGRASYSHKGKFHTLDEIAQYDRNGLWEFNRARFSKHGTLVKTIVHLVECSPDGYFASELQSLLGVRVHNALAQLYGRGQLKREQLVSEYLYLCPQRAEEQSTNRHEAIFAAAESEPFYEEDMSPPVAQSMQLLLSVLNEKQRRLYLGLESMKQGLGGDVIISRISGVNVKTIARGRRELLARDVSVDRIRKAGAGRPSIKKNRGDRTSRGVDGREHRR